MRIEVECPECGAAVKLPRDAEVGDVIDCPECETPLEVTDLNPPTLDIAPDSYEGDENGESEEGDDDGAAWG